MNTNNHTRAHSLDAFTDWVSAKHGATFDAMGTTPDGDAYRAHLASFGRTNTALQLLTEFKAAHPSSASEDGGDSDSPSMLVNMDKRRHMACLEATWELDVIARALPGLVPNIDEETYSAQFLVRAMAGRLLRLSSVLMCALSDDTVPTDSLERILSLDGGQG